jgi:PAS domain S-box-containing protein
MKMFSTLRRVLLSNTLLVALLPLFIVGFISLYFIESGLKNRITRENRALANSASHEAERYLRQLTKSLEHIASTLKTEGIVREEGVDQFLLAELHNYAEFESLVIVDERGVVRHAVYATSALGKGKMNPAVLNAMDHAVRSRKPVWSSSYIVAPGAWPSVTLAMPAKDRVILGTVTLAGLNDIIQRIAEDNGYAYIVNGKGVLVAHPDRELVKREFSIADLSIVRRALKGELGTSRYLFLGIERQGTIVPIAGTDWFLAVAQTVDEAYAPIRKVKITLVVGMLATALLALFFAFWSLSRLLRPLEGLCDKVQAIAGGDYNQNTPYFGMAELDRLADGVRMMAMAVNEREEELAVQNEELASIEEELRTQVDEYHQSQEQLVRSNAVLEAIFSSSPVAIVAVDLSGFVTLWNQAAESIFGWSAAEAVGRFLPFVGVTYEGEFKAMRQELLANGSILSREIQRRNKQGELLELRHSSAVLRNVQGEPWGLMAVYTDITEQKRAALALERSEEFFRLTFDQSTIGAAVMDRNYNFLRVNGELCRLTGYSEAELLAMNVAQINYPGDFGSCAANAEKLLTGEISRYRTDKRYCHKGGSTVWVNLSVCLLRDPTSDDSIFLALMEEISDRKGAEEKIRLLNAELEQRVADRTAQLQAANRELESFCFSVSHDLRAPLRHIDSYCQIFLEEYGQTLDETGAGYLRRVSRATWLMGELIEALLSLSRLTREDVCREEMAIGELVREVASELKHAQPERNVEFIIDDQLRVNADPRLMKIVMDNLLGNAWKYSGKKDKAVIEFGQMESAEGPVLFVRDNGAGFNMLYANKLFGAFQRLHREEEFEGTGIGLATVQRIIHRHGGKIWAHAVEGEGATFSFSLPAGA